MKPPHLGQLIAARLRELGMSQAEFSRRIHTSRQNVNLILKKETLDSGLLFRISRILQMNFFQLMSEAPFGGPGVEFTLQLNGQRLRIVTYQAEGLPETKLYPKPGKN
ncbi:MAG: helix-turn-helix domain-containing protein, partial [Bacteroidota bacterium]